MTSTVGTTLLVLVTILCLFTTLTAGFAPVKFADALGYTIANPGGLNEIRAQYACFFLAVGTACLGALLGYVPRRTAMFVCALVFGGLFVGRAVSLALNGGMAGYGPAVRALVFVDFVGIILSLAALNVEQAA